MSGPIVSGTENDDWGGLLIVGAGGHGRVVADAAEASRRWSRIAFLDARYPDLVESGIWPVVASDRELETLVKDGWSCIVGLGQSPLRLEVLDRVESAGLTLATVVHPAAAVSRHAFIGSGTVVCAQAAVNIGARTGRGCIVNTGATVDHDCELSDGVHVAPGAHLAGGVRIGRCSFIGMSAAVKELVVIGNDATVGSGAAVVQDVPDGAMALGVPAQIRARGARKT